MITALQGTTNRLPMAAALRPAALTPLVPASTGDRMQLRPLIRPTGLTPLPTATLPQFTQVPQAAPTAILGTVDYYRWRAADFSRRHPGQAVPDYYLGYGDKYAHRFSEKLAPRLTPDGQRWLAATRLNLQTAMEQALRDDPATFATMELSDNAFTRFAYRTHPTAYLKAGISDLHVKDLMAIASTPDLRDVANAKGLAQLAAVAGAMLEHRLDWAGRQFGQEIAVVGRAIAPGAAREGAYGVEGVLKVAARIHLP